MVISGGYVVTCFIVLLGFFSIYKYEEGSSIKGMIYYAVNRMRKFYPVHLLMFMFAIPFAFGKYNQFSIEERLEVVVLYNTFTQSLMPMGDYFFAFNPVERTMSVIFISYFLTSVMVVVLQRCLDKKYKAFIVMIFILFIEALYIFILKNNINYTWFCGVKPLFRMLDYFLGEVCAYSWIRLTNNGKQNSRTYKSFLEVLVFGLVVLIHFVVTPRLPAYYNWSLVWATISVIVITVFKFEEGILSKYIFQNRVMVFLGKISFEFYIVHVLVLNYVGLYIEVIWVRIAVSYIVTLLIAYLLHKYITIYNLGKRNKMGFK